MAAPAGTFMEASGAAFCQYDGKGDFISVTIDLKHDGQFTISDSQRQPASFSVVGAKASAPKSKRKGHPNAFRLDAADGQKFIFSVTTADDLEHWTTALRKGSGTGCAPGIRILQLQCPPGVAPGGTVQAMVGGQTINVQVPPGVMPGETFKCETPAQQYKVVASAIVRKGMSTKAKHTRTIPPGQIITVLETGQSEGHQRARISDSEWVSIRTAQGSVLLVPIEPPPAAAAPAALPVAVSGAQPSAFCTGCGAPNSTAESFCSECGQPGDTEQVAPAPALTPAPAARQQQEMIQIQCPAGVGPGTMLQASHNGMTFNIAIPAGVGPGQMFQVCVRVCVCVHPTCLPRHPCSTSDPLLLLACWKD